LSAIELYLDPICPFSWVTWRWLQQAATATGRTCTLRQMSLAILNEGKDVDSHQRNKLAWSRRLGRVFAAVTARGGPEAFANLYDAFGTLMYDAAKPSDETVLTEALAATKVGTTLVDALDNPAWDEDVRITHRRSQDALGGSAGSPIIVVNGRGFFGPVLTSVPGRDDGVTLLDAVLTAASTPGFAVLQRPYQGPPRAAASENR